MQGARALAAYLIGLLPGVMLLGAYDWLAFGSPFHPSYRYNVVGQDRSTGGVLGMYTPPNWHAIELVLWGYRGLLVLSPVVIAAAFGLWLLWRRGLRAEVAVCALLSAAFLIGEFGYSWPYGGVSPGPRYLVPALPFAALGLGPAFARLRLATWLLAVVSIVATLAITLTWTADTNYSGTIWGQIVRLPFQRGSADIIRHLTGNVFVWMGLGRVAAAGLVFAAAGAALVASAGPGRQSPS